MQKTICEIDKPMYIGFSVLELSKLLMYEFHYDWVLKKYPRDKVHLLFTDTDSLVYEIETEDVYKDMVESSNRFDLSNYSKDSEFYNATNQMVVGKMKDEAEGHIITEVVALRPKMYSYKKLKAIEVEQYEEMKRAKGIKKAVVAKDIHFDDYKAQLDKAHENYLTAQRIGHKRHHLFTYKQSKRGLCAYDDKRYLLDDGVNTLAHGHYKIRNKQRQASDGTKHEHKSSQDGVVNIRDEDGEEFTLMSHAAVSRQPMLTYLLHHQEDEDMNLHHLAARGDQDIEEDDAQSTTMEDSGDARSHIPSLADAEAEEASADSGDDEEPEQAMDVIAPSSKCGLVAMVTPDMRAVNLAIDVARYTLHPHGKVTEVHRDGLCAAIRKRTEPDAVRALWIVQQAQTSNKAVALSPMEKLIFKQVKDMIFFKTRYEADVRKRIFQLLSGRSENWWDKNHMRAQATI
jgi:hypothetical protein